MRTILWRRLDREGLETSRLRQSRGRLDLAVGEQAEVRAAWLRFPSFTLEPLVQTYRRTGAHTYRYESGGGRFTADLEVDDDGVVVHYPGFCARVS